ncbi:ribbon-helix-helix domain-containing protein [Sporosarcina sp. FSL K6-1508]|uniref:ribbon-helix-helix domain-containing protein n=1 Tax=Sporosarcina sp. FSL K6-1508 TaxID=2921553 RepID=UPI0030FBBF20
MAKKKDTLVNRTRLSNSIRNDLNDAFNQLTKDTNITKSKLLDQAIELLLKEHNRPIHKD